MGAGRLGAQLEGQVPVTRRVILENTAETDMPSVRVSQGGRRQGGVVVYVSPAVVVSEHTGPQ